MLVCTVLPTYSEKENIGPLIERLLQAVAGPYMVIVVDDNSPDGTGDVVQQMADRYNQPGETRVVLVRRTHERGLTSAIQRGINEAIYMYGADIVTWMDCDLSMPPEDVPKLVRAIREQRADVAIGSRWVPGGADVAHGAMARSLSWIINNFAITLIGEEVHDYTSGFVAAHATVLKTLLLRGDYGEYCIDFLTRAIYHGYQLVEVPYICVPRYSGESKTGINLWDYLYKGRHYVSTILRLTREKQFQRRALPLESNM
ncbi:MAG: polyprenol monophosphomannose synthase [Ardenticatenaceae bacterium]